MKINIGISLSILFLIFFSLIFFPAYKSPPFKMFTILDYVITSYLTLVLISFILIIILVFRHWHVTMFKEVAIKKYWLVALCIGPAFFLISQFVYFVVVIIFHKGEVQKTVTTEN